MMTGAQDVHCPDATPIDLVAGGDGLIGRALVEHLADRNIPVLATTRHRGARPDRLHLDLAENPDQWVLPSRISTAYLLAGTTNMAACESDMAETRRINVTNTLALAGQLRDRGGHVVVVSTNLVHAGTTPFATIDRPVAPQNTYAAQKTEVERALLEAGNASILRITKIAESIENLATQWAANLVWGKPVQPFSDLVCAPVALTQVIDVLTELGRRRESGIYQFGADRDVSYPEIAVMLADRIGVDRSLVRPVSSRDAGVRLAACPAYTTLESAATFCALGIGAWPVEKALYPVLDRAIEKARSPA
jgi:dTDP-4-dehydrorhamnose reductase